MRSRIRSLSLYAAMLLALALCISLGAPVQAEESAGRAVSLKTLQSAAKAGSSKQSLTLCGITRVDGFIIDAENKDIVLFGQIDPSLPALYLDDLVVALRNAKLMYAKKAGNTYTYSAPGCSIDPDPDILRQLQQIRGLHQEGWIDQWRQVGSHTQSVKVMGVPFSTRFAKTMVDADYLMKRLVNGSMDLGIDGFQSLTDMRMEISKARKNGGAGRYDTQAAMNRFWFCPGECRYATDSSIVALNDCRVQLLTESEFLADSGQIVGAGRSDALAQRFADSFTAKYQEIADVKPIYKDLEGLFRFTALAKIMDETMAEKSSGVNLTYLKDEYDVTYVTVARKLPGITNVNEFRNRQQTNNGYVDTSTIFVSCGGVSMDVRPMEISSGSAAYPRTEMKQIRESILTARTSKTALYWPFKISG